MKQSHFTPQLSHLSLVFGFMFKIMFTLLDY
jgi:hypothetical protein